MIKAFPKMNEKQPSYQDGMDLRDWFAGLALQSIIIKTVVNHNIENREADNNYDATLAYGYADAMMKERNDRMEEKTSVPKD